MPEVSQELITARAAAAALAFPVAGPQDGDPIETLLAKILGLQGGGTVQTLDGGAGWVTSLGVGGARITSVDMSGAAVDITDAPGADLKVVLTDLIVSVEAAMRVDVKMETSDTVLLSLYLAANSTVNLVTRGKLKGLVANKKLRMQTSAAGGISVTPLWHAEA